MGTEPEIRNYIRQVLTESVNNFIDKEEETATKQLDDASKPQDLGDPLTDVKMNTMANELGSDEKNAPTVSVKPGETKGGNGPETGQRKANFQDKTELAETVLVSIDQLKEYITNALNEKYDKAIKKEEEIKEGVVEELLGEPISGDQASEIDEAGRSHTTGRTTHLKLVKTPNIGQDLFGFL